MRLARRGSSIAVQPTVVESTDALQLGHLLQPDDVSGLQQTLLHEQHQGRTAGHHVRVLAVRVEELEGLAQRGRGVVIECIHSSDSEYTSGVSCLFAPVSPRFFQELGLGRSRQEGLDAVGEALGEFLGIADQVRTVARVGEVGQLDDRLGDAGRHGMAVAA